MTSSALLDCTNDWYVNLDRGVCNLFFFLAVQKAFGTVDHETFFKQFIAYGTTGSALNISFTRS